LIRSLGIEHAHLELKVLHRPSALVEPGGEALLEDAPRRACVQVDLFWINHTGIEKRSRESREIDLTLDHLDKAGYSGVNFGKLESQVWRCCGRCGSFEYAHFGIVELHCYTPDQFRIAVEKGAANGLSFASRQKKAPKIRGKAADRSLEDRRQL
jgi:hypothetical protein